jgi:DnaD/phage-associated family protein
MASIKGKTQVDDKQPVALPACFFSELLPDIDDLAELKVTIFALAALQQKEGDYRFLRLDEFTDDRSLMWGMPVSDEATTARDSLTDALDKAVARGTLLLAQIEIEGETRRYYTRADEDGSALRQRIQDGDWQPAADGEIELLPLRPTVFALYEDNIGVLTPMIVDSLKEATATYPPGWIEEAIRLAVERNIRHWRYIRGILEKWQQEGRLGEKRGRHHRRRNPNRAR